MRERDLLIGGGLDWWEIKIDEIDTVLIKDVFDLSSGGSLNGEVSESVMDLSDLFIQVDNLGHEVLRLDILGRVLHREFKATLQLPIFIELQNRHNRCRERIDRRSHIEML